jgi:hypothetical protein
MSFQDLNLLVHHCLKISVANDAMCSSFVVVQQKLKRDESCAEYVRYNSVESELKLTAWNVPGIQAFRTLIDEMQSLDTYSYYIVFKWTCIQ